MDELDVGFRSFRSDEAGDDVGLALSDELRSHFVAHFVERALETLDELVEIPFEFKTN